MQDDADLRATLETLDPKARDDFRRVLIHDQADRGAISSRLLRYRDRRGDDWADIIEHADDASSRTISVFSSGAGRAGWGAPPGMGVSWTIHRDRRPLR